jgi:hypothetical protein
MEVRHLLLFESELVANISGLSFEYGVLQVRDVSVETIAALALVPTAYTSVFCAIYQPHTHKHSASCSLFSTWG